MPDLTPFLISGLSTGAIYVLSGVGLVVLFRASGVLNLAQGALGAFGALIAWTIIDIGGAQWMGWVAGIIAATLLSLLYGRLLGPRLASSDPIVRSIATLGFALALLGLMEFIWHETPRSLRLPTDTMGFEVFDVRVTYTRAIAFGISLIATLAIVLLLNRTRLGLNMRALANDRDNSAILGVPILRVDAWAWMLSGTLAGVSGMLLANMVRLQAMPLTFMIIPAVAVTIAGRLRSLAATVVSGLVIGVMEAMAMPFHVIAPYRSAVPFVFAVGALLWLQRHGVSLASPDMKKFGIALNGASGAARFATLQMGVKLVVFLAIAALLPQLVSGYWLEIFTSACILGLASLSLSVLYAQLGMVSLCQYSLVGVGGWFALRIAHGMHVPFEVALIGGGIAAALFGLIAGLPALRMRGLYLALVTLMLAGAFQVVISAWGFPDGGPGITGRVTSGPRFFMARPYLAQSDPAYFRYAMVLVALGFLLVRWHQRSKAGRSWALIRRGEACALTSGANIVAYKIWAFTLAGFLAGISGALLAGSVGQLDGRAFPASDSIMLFAIMVIAGAYHWSGPIIAGLMLRAVPALLTSWKVDGNIATLIFGAALLYALITTPEGISGKLSNLGRTFTARTAMLWARMSL